MGRPARVRSRDTLAPILIIREINYYERRRCMCEYKYMCGNQLLRIAKPSI